MLTSIAAQAQESGIVGTVTDSSGAVLVGATITAKNVNTGEERQATTSAIGQFAVPNLQPGTYQVTGTKQGFESKVVDQVTLEVQAVRTVDFVL
ncbi:MAG TPA: carboxypeptidase-like regulatory domain-containing protein, partial [Terriglobales bacterium]|nr:carboxypeptidase-like regulatory domain-containing protein [Terriglobales bacterium]